jgi:dihydroorotase-like cyclic amidohydrolase
MKKAIFLLVLSLITLTGIGQVKPDLIIKDVNIIPISENKLIIKQSIAVTNGIITAISDFDKIEKDKNTIIIEGQGKFVMPGLAEMHSHLPSSEKLDTFLMANIAAGVTRLRAMNSVEPVLKIKQLISTKTIAPHLYYPYIFTKNELVSSLSQVDSLMSVIKKDGYDFIKMFSIANEPLFDNLMRAANANNIIVCGHYPNMVKLDKVIASGYKSIEHLAGYEKIRSESEITDIVQLTRKHGLYNCPTLDWDVTAADLQLFDNYKKRLVFNIAPKHYLDSWNKELENYIAKTGKEKIIKGQESYLPVFQRKTHMLKKLNDAGALLLLGSDPGSLFQLHGFNMYEEMLHWANAGLSNYDILKAATINPATFFNQEKEWGTVEKGKIADLILLDKNPMEDIRNMQTLELTIIKGKVFKKTELLKKM